MSAARVDLGKIIIGLDGGAAIVFGLLIAVASLIWPVSHWYGPILLPINLDLGALMAIFGAGILFRATFFAIILMVLYGVEAALGIAAVAAGRGGNLQIVELAIVGGLALLSALAIGAIVAAKKAQAKADAAEMLTGDISPAAPSLGSQQARAKAVLLLTGLFSCLFGAIWLYTGVRHMILLYESPFGGVSPHSVYLTYHYYAPGALVGVCSIGHFKRIKALVIATLGLLLFVLADELLLSMEFALMESGLSPFEYYRVALIATLMACNFRCITVLGWDNQAVAALDPVVAAKLDRAKTIVLAAALAAILMGLLAALASLTGSHPFGREVIPAELGVGAAFAALGVGLLFRSMFCAIIMMVLYGLGILAVLIGVAIERIALSRLVIMVLPVGLGLLNAYAIGAIATIRKARAAADTMAAGAAMPPIPIQAGAGPGADSIATALGELSGQEPLLPIPTRQQP
jgi:hypothetical protein